jgi:predicted transcriptional regulator
VARVGELQAAVLDVLWAATGPLTVRQVLEQLPADRRDRAYTTVMTVLERLHGKGLVVRALAGRAWSYQPAQTRAQHIATLMAQALAAADDRSAALVAFARALTPAEAAAFTAALTG